MQFPIWQNCPRFLKFPIDRHLQHSHSFDNVMIDQTLPSSLDSLRQLSFRTLLPCWLPSKPKKYAKAVFPTEFSSRYTYVTLRKSVR